MNFVKDSIESTNYKRDRYFFPPITLLKSYTKDDVFTNSDRVKSIGKWLQETCDNFSIGAQVIDTNVTSMAITYLLRLDTGVSIRSITKMKADFELNLGEEIEITGLGEERGTIQIVVKNMKRPLVGLRSVIESSEFKNSHSPLTIAAGVDIQGTPLCIDICSAPHMLIAGSTGSGKSIFIDDILISILYKATPEDVRLLLVDPKQVELNPYNNIPHLLAPVIYKPEQSLGMFMWVEDEMLKRYNTFQSANVKTIDAFNDVAGSYGYGKMPRILVIIDEYMNLIMDAPHETNQVIDRIARLGRAAGVHLILATQLPIAKVVTPQIKSNIPCRASFTVVDGRESRVILDRTGAERLLGNGDMIFSKSDNTGITHAQAAYVSETELWDVVDFINCN